MPSYLPRIISVYVFFGSSFTPSNLISPKFSTIPILFVLSRHNVQTVYLLPLIVFVTSKLRLTYSFLHSLRPSHITRPRVANLILRLSFLFPISYLTLPNTNVHTLSPATRFYKITLNGTFVTHNARVASSRPPRSPTVANLLSCIFDNSLVQPTLNALKSFYFINKSTSESRSPMIVFPFFVSFIFKPEPGRFRFSPNLFSICMRLCTHRRVCTLFICARKYISRFATEFACHYRVRGREEGKLITIISRAVDNGAKAIRSASILMRRSPPAPSPSLWAMRRAAFKQP